MYELSNWIRIFEFRWPLKVEGQGQTLKSSKSNISKTVRNGEKESMEVHVWVSYGIKIFKTFDFRWPLKVKVKPWNVWSQISQKRYEIESVSIEVREEVMYGLSNGMEKFDLRWPLKVKGPQLIPEGQKSRSKTNPEKFEAEYFKNGTRKSESVNRS